MGWEGDGVFLVIFEKELNSRSTGGVLLQTAAYRYTTRNFLQRELAQTRLELAEMEAAKDDLEVQLVNLLHITSEKRK